MGYKEIEVGFPAASQTDFDFVRELIEGDRIPDDVVIQVLTQAREDLIERTFESLAGARRAPSCTCTTRPRRFSGGWSSTARTIKAARGQRTRRSCKRRRSARRPRSASSTRPRSSPDTELDFALEVCEAVMDVWQPTPERKIILNLPRTVERSTPNVYADQIEWMSRT
jgi:2-isopropylmalate synthase